MKRTICKECNPQRETIIGAETHCSECGTEIIHIISMKRSKKVFAQMREQEIEIENESTYNYYY